MTVIIAPFGGQLAQDLSRTFFPHWSYQVSTLKYISRGEEVIGYLRFSNE